MVPFFVLPPADEQRRPETSVQCRPRNAQAADEQAFYETHGSEGAVRLLWLVEWLGQALQSRRIFRGFVRQRSSAVGSTR